MAGLSSCRQKLLTPLFLSFPAPEPPLPFALSALFVLLLRRFLLLRRLLPLLGLRCPLSGPARVRLPLFVLGGVLSFFPSSAPFWSGVLLFLAARILALFSLFLSLLLLGNAARLSLPLFLGDPPFLPFLLFPYCGVAHPGNIFFDIVIEFVFVRQAAEQSSAYAGDLCGVEHHLLLLGHADRDRFEVLQERGTAQIAAARPVSPNKPGHVPDAYLAHLDPDLERVRQFLHQLAKIHAGPSVCFRRTTRANPGPRSDSTITLSPTETSTPVVSKS